MVKHFIKEGLQFTVNMLFILLFACFITGNLKFKDDENKLEVICLELEQENASLKEELRKWEDHCIRMKRICGVPDTVSWTYKQKVTHCVDLKNLEEWKIN